MKKLFHFISALAVLAILIPGSASADYPKGAPFINPFINDSIGGPDLFGYIWMDENEPGISYAFVDTTSGSGWVRVTGLGDDNFVGPFGVGFPFRYYYYNVTQFWIGSNGYIAFNGANIASPFPTIPNPAAPNDFIAGMTSDLNFQGTGNQGKCYYRNSADSLIVSWYDVPFWQQAAPGYTGSNTFQIILSRLDSSITFQYKSQSGLTSNNDITIGIENISGQIGLMHSKNRYPIANSVVKYIYPFPVTYQVTDVAVNWINNLSTGGIFQITGDSITVNGNIANTGNQNVPGFNTIIHIRNSANVVIQTDTISTPPIIAGDDADITSPNKFVPSTAGVYRITFTTTLPGDQVAINNVKNFELEIMNRVITPQEMKYDDGTSESSISWSGGTGSVAQYFIPPAYPVTIDTLKYFIATTGPGFFARIYDDDGPNGLPGTILYTSTVSNPPAGLRSVVVNPPLSITSGGFYVSWDMNGEGIAIGEDQSLPISNRSLEGFAGIFSTYRNGAERDPIIRAVVNLPSSVSVQSSSTEVPVRYTLNQNYPNPFNPETRIDFAIPKDGFVTLKVFDILGREVAVVVKENLKAGTYTADFNAAGLNSGIYFYRLQSGSYMETRKMLLVK
jgi:hypothetical protein